jgi:peptidoglycan/LPS O-acetylase OafA/YrhL
MGRYRFLLAILVVLSHAGFDMLGYNPGPVAVVSFLLLSGYVMTVLIRKYYADPNRIGDFYLDRAARLFPQFIFYLLLTLGLVSAFNVSSPFLTGCTIGKIGLNLPILPLDFFQLIGLGDCMLVPQAWSLGLELSFYIVVPILIILVTRFGCSLMALGSIGVFVLAYLGVFDTDIYGYRLLPGTLFIFLAGAAFAQPNLLWRHFPWFVWIGSIILYGIAHLEPFIVTLPYNKEVLLGLVVGIPALAFLRMGKYTPVDEFFGNLSYGMFLNHFLCLYTMKLLDIEINRFRPFILLLAISTLLSAASYYAIERPALLWRRKLRYHRTSPLPGKNVPGPFDSQKPQADGVLIPCAPDQIGSKPGNR